MGKYKEGQSGNPAGRPKGAKNKVSPLTKQEITEFLTDQWPQIKRDFGKLDPAQRMQYFWKIAGFVFPQPRENNLSVNFDQLTDQQIDQILDKLFGNENKG